jgi:transporter family-2 protein
MRVTRPSVEKIAAARWWAWDGGLAGSAYSVSAILLAGRPGAATLMALVLTGQLVASVILDHFGWVGFEVQTASAGRIVSCFLMLAGLACTSVF